MPNTGAPWGFEHENLTDEPTRTLNGGSDGLAPILARQIHDALDGVVGDVADLVADLAAVQVQATSAQVLATIDTGSGTNTTEFTSIPGDYRDLMIHWTGASDGSGQINSLALRFNGDAGDNYVSRLSRNVADGTFTSADGIGDNFVFSVLRAGYVGTRNDRRSSGTIWIPDYSRAGVTKAVQGIAWARGQSGATNVFNVWAGGNWTGTSAINAIRIWVSSQLWAVDPHITLIGFR